MAHGKVDRDCGSKIALFAGRHRAAQRSQLLARLMRIVPDISVIERIVADASSAGFLDPDEAARIQREFDAYFADISERQADLYVGLYLAFDIRSNRDR